MADAVFLGGNRYHKAEEAHAGIGPVLEKAQLSVHYTDDYASIGLGRSTDSRLGVCWNYGAR